MVERTNPTRVDADLYEQFKRAVDDLHGSHHGGNTRLELERAMRERIGAIRGDDVYAAVDENGRKLDRILDALDVDADTPPHPREADSGGRGADPTDRGFVPEQPAPTSQVRERREYLARRLLAERHDDGGGMVNLSTDMTDPAYAEADDLPPAFEIIGRVYGYTSDETVRKLGEDVAMRARELAERDLGAKRGPGQYDADVFVWGRLLDLPYAQDDVDDHDGIESEADAELAALDAADRET